MKSLEHIHRPNKCLKQCRFPVDRVVGGAISMINVGTEYFPMVAIFMSLEDSVCVGFEIGVPLRYPKTFSVGGGHSND